MPSSRSRSSRASSSAAPPTADEPSEPKPPTAEPETAEAARTRTTIRKPSKASARKRLDSALPVAIADVDAPAAAAPGFAFPALLSPRSRAGVELSRASAARRAAAVAADAARRAHDARRVPAVRVARAAPPPPPPPVSGPPPAPPPEAMSGEAGDLRVRRVDDPAHRGPRGEAFYDALGGTWHRDAAAAHASHLQVRVLRAELLSLPPPDDDELSSLATPLPSDDDDSDGDESDDENDPASPASRLFNKAMTALLGGEYAGELCERE